MTSPQGMFSTPSLDVCHLKQSLYGLKQAPRAWFDKFHSTLLDFHFVQINFDSSFFLYKTAIRIVVFLVYVDDIAIIGTDSQLIEQLQWHPKAFFHMKDLVRLLYFLSLEVQTTLEGTSLHQHKYIQEVITLSGL